MTAMPQLLRRLAANPWALSCTSFMLTALVIRLSDFNLV
jgi:hypothetical protein